jgi:Flp pilus assembly pilin Flp
METSAEDGATAVEYALMAGLIAVVIATAVGAFGLAVSNLFQSFLNQAPF